MTKNKQRFLRPLFFCDKMDSFLKNLLIFSWKYEIIKESVYSLNLEDEKVWHSFLILNKTTMV